MSAEADPPTPAEDEHRPTRWRVVTIPKPYGAGCIDGIAPVCAGHANHELGNAHKCPGPYVPVGDDELSEQMVRALNADDDLGAELDRLEARCAALEADIHQLAMALGYTQPLNVPFAVLLNEVRKVVAQVHADRATRKTKRIHQLEQNLAAATNRERLRERELAARLGHGRVLGIQIAPPWSDLITAVGALVSDKRSIDNYRNAAIAAEGRTTDAHQLLAEVVVERDHLRASTGGPGDAALQEGITEGEKAINPNDITERYVARDLWIRALAEAQRLRYQRNQAQAELNALRKQRIVDIIFGHPPNAPRPFGLRRHTDVTGVSGTGFVAEGVVWGDGTVNVRWLGDKPSVVFWRSLNDALAVHGHDGATEVVWLSEELEPLAEMERQRDAALLVVDAARTFLSNDASPLEPLLTAVKAFDQQVQSGVRVHRRHDKGEPCTDECESVDLTGGSDLDARVLADPRRPQPRSCPTCRSIGTPRNNCRDPWHMRDPATQPSGVHRPASPSNTADTEGEKTS